LRLDMLVLRAPRKGEQCVTRLRATLLAASNGPVTLDLVAACDLWPQQKIELHAGLADGIAHELPSLKFIPQAAGAEVIRFEATPKNDESLPLGRWVANHDMIVEDAAPAAGPITAEKGATVIVSTGLGALPNLRPTLPTSWQSVPLQPDAAYQLRLKAACPT